MKPMGASQVAILADPNSRCGEAPLWDDSHKQLYWSDCGDCRAYVLDWATGRWNVFGDAIEINGWVLDDNGSFVITNNSGFWQWSGEGKLRQIAAEVDGHPCRLNDCVADERGRVLSGSWFYDPCKPYPLGRLLSLGVDGRVRVVDEGFQLANGLAFSPDNLTLYFADSARRCVWAYDYDIETGTATNRRVHASIPPECGLPDGLAVDCQGHLWVAEWYGSRVAGYNFNGELVQSLPVPAKQISSVAFAGPALGYMVITSAGRSEPMPIMPPGYDAESGYFGGSLFSIPTPVPGIRCHRSRIT